MLAINWAEQIKNNYIVFLGIHNRSVNISGVSIIKIDFLSIKNLEKSIEGISPDIIINCIGLTNIEECEKFPEIAKDVNSIIPYNVAKICKKFRIKFIHISTDHLFDGNKKFNKEEDIPNPQNQYATSKHQAEINVLKILNNALIIRTNFFGWGTSYRKSFSDYIIENLRLNKEISLFSDVFYTPILIDDLVNAIHDLVNLNENGIFNVVGEERISKYNFGLKIATVFGLNINLIKSSEFHKRTDLVKRPLDLSICNSKLTSLLNRNIGNIDKQIIKLLSTEKIKQNRTL